MLGLEQEVPGLAVVLGGGGTPALERQQPAQRSLNDAHVGPAVRSLEDKATWHVKAHENSPQEPG